MCFGGVTGARHQVVHTEAAEHELARFGAEGRPCSIAVMMRTALFPHCRGRTSDTTFSLWSAFECMTTVFRESLASLPFELPTLEECEATYKASWPSKTGLAAECSLGTETTTAQEAGLTAECSRGTETTPAQETGMTVQDVERLRLHPYSPSGRNGNNKRKRCINRKNSGKGTSGIGK